MTYILRRPTYHPVNWKVNGEYAQTALCLTLYTRKSYQSGRVSPTDKAAVFKSLSATDAMKLLLRPVGTATTVEMNRIRCSQRHHLLPEHSCQSTQMSIEGLVLTYNCWRLLPFTWNRKAIENLFRNITQDAIAWLVFPCFIGIVTSDIWYCYSQLSY